MTTTLDTSLTGRRDHADTVNPNYQRWAKLISQTYDRVTGSGGVYTIELSDLPEQQYTHKVIGSEGVVYGYWAEHSGRYVTMRRPGWTNHRGVLGTFTSADDQPTLRVRGWATP